jgi:hypothetical protein
MHRACNRQVASIYLSEVLVRDFPFLALFEEVVVTDVRL